MWGDPKGSPLLFGAARRPSLARRERAVLVRPVSPYGGGMAQQANSIENCALYHTMDIPGHGTVSGYWDLRGNVDPYLGRVALAGRSVLEIGPADGFLSLEMERRGARVVAVDVPANSRTDHFPVRPAPAQAPPNVEKERNAFWLVHRAARSSVELIESHIDDLEPAVAGFDIAFVGNVLQHLRNPIGALINISDRANTI